MGDLRSRSAVRAPRPGASRGVPRHLGGEMVYLPPKMSPLGAEMTRGRRAIGGTGWGGDVGALSVGATARGERPTKFVMNVNTGQARRGERGSGASRSVVAPAEPLPPPLPLAAALARVQRANAHLARRVALPSAVIVAHFWHIFNDAWCATLPGGIAHTLLSIGLVVLAWRAYPPLGALMVLGQPALLAASLGVLHSFRSSSDSVASHVVHRFQFKADDGCLLEPDTRLVSCPAIGWRGCVPPLFDYTPVNMAATNLAERITYALFGSPTTSYLGPLPTPQQLRVAAQRVHPTVYDLSSDAGLGDDDGVTTEMAWDIQFDLPIDAQAADNTIQVRVAPFAPGLLVIATADLTWAQLRLLSHHGGTVPGYHSVDLSQPSTPRGSLA